MSALQPILQGADSPPKEARSSLWGMTWRRFRRNPMNVGSLVWILLIFLLAIIGPLLAPQNYATENFSDYLQPPSWHYLFGTNANGQDMLSQILYSIRFSMIIAVGATFISWVIGVVLGLWAGLAGGFVDNFMMRLVDLMFAFPSYFLNLILVVSLGRGLVPIFLSIGITQWAGHARLVRGLVLSTREGEMVEAARSLGASPGHLGLRYVWPSIMGPLIISVAMGFPFAMTQDAALSIVGMGLQPPMPSFGNLVNSGLNDVLAFPWLLYIPSGLFALTLLSWFIFGNGLQDALNPKGDS